MKSGGLETVPAFYFNPGIMSRLLLFLLFVSTFAVAQKHDLENITTTEISEHLSFLASDAMRGRDTGSPELVLAGNYIASMFQQYGVKHAPGMDSYFQKVDLVKTTPASTLTATIGKNNYVFKDDLLILAGQNINYKGDLVYAGFGMPEDLDKVNIKGKIVLTLAGSRDADNLNKVFSAGSDKLIEVKKRGGVALIELFSMPQAPWPALVNYFSGSEKWSIESSTSIPHVWLKIGNVSSLKLKDKATVSGSLMIDGIDQENVPGRNVVGYVEGTDAALKDEFIILTAHYDHVGVQKNAPADADSIFNGARDNAIGTVALLQAAKYLAANPAKRSVLIVALTSEEKGLLGSRWYADNPVLPLNKHVLNINCDGVGYNDKSILTSISFGRTNTDRLVEAGATEFGLNIGGDPDPRENFFERSDQVSFARKGVPAIKLQPGLAKMDDEIRKYYHRQADEVETLDFDYLLKFYRAYVRIVDLLANDTTRPQWIAGDKFEAAAKALYGK